MPVGNGASGGGSPQNEPIDALDLINFQAAMLINTVTEVLPEVDGVTYFEADVKTITTEVYTAVNTGTSTRKIMEITSACADGTYLLTQMSVNSADFAEDSYMFLSFGNPIPATYNAYTGAPNVHEVCQKYYRKATASIKMSVVGGAASFKLKLDGGFGEDGTGSGEVDMDNSMFILSTTPLEVHLVVASSTVGSAGLSVDLGELQSSDLT